MTLRKPQERYLQFVDDEQWPVPGVVVTSHLFFSHANHCAVSMDERFLAEGISVQDGRVQIPDGDFEYLIYFEKPSYWLSGFDQFNPPFGASPWEYLTYLEGQEIMVGLHKLTKQPLRMVVTRDGVPAADEILWGWWIGCTCFCGDVIVLDFGHLG